MKIMIQNSIFYPDVIGGAEVATHVLAVQLSERGWQVDAMTTTGRRGGADRLTTRPLEGTTGQVYEAGSSGFQDLYEDGAPAPQANLPVRALHHFSTVYSRKWQRLAGEALDRSRPDLLHTNTIVGMSPAIWRTAGERNIPVVHTLHDYYLLCPRTTLLRSRGTDCLEPPLPCRVLASLKLAQCKGVQVVTAPSHYVLQRHLQAGGFADARAEVVPNACEYLPESIPERPMAGAQRGLYLGQLAPHKGLPGLLAALDLLFADPACADLQFDFAGAGPLDERVVEFCAAHGDRARFHGLVAGEAKSRLLSNASWLVLPSVWQDNFPLVMLDAFSWGLPVIGSRRGGIPEVVRHDREGLIVEPGPKELADAMRRYLLEPGLRPRHGAAARKRAAEFTRDRQVDRFEAIYDSLLEGREP